MPLFSQAHFLRAVAQPRDLPAPAGAEFAFAGRSNVGKSSAINALLGRRQLARTSKTPGRTQTINFYEIGEDARLVDLPGYGFARVSKAVREQWAKLVGAYLRDRSTLRAVVLVMDARHPLTPLDRQLLGWLDAYRLAVLLSKADKLTRREQAEVRSVVDAALRAARPEAVPLLYSSETRQGVEELRALLDGWLSDPASQQAREIKSPR